MYEKVKVENSEVPEGACGFCERPKSMVICAGCGNLTNNVRHRKRCTQHPREFFLMDIVNCRNCKGTNLLEFGLDDIPDNLIAALPEPESPPTPTSSGSRTLSPSPPHDSSARPSSSGLGIPFPSPPLSNNGRLSSSGLSPIKENSNPVESMDVIEHSVMAPAPLQPRNVQGNPALGRGRGLKRQRVSLTQIQAANNGSNVQGGVGVARVVPVSSPIRTQASTSAPAPVPVSVDGGTCVCMRKAHFLVCSSCGYYAQNVRKFIPCAVHPMEKGGMKFCPECGAAGDNLDETSF